MDPLGYVDGLNLYTYVRNNPANFIDLLGTRIHNAEEARRLCQEQVKAIEGRRPNDSGKRPDDAKPLKCDLPGDGKETCLAIADTIVKNSQSAGRKWDQIHKECGGITFNCCNCSEGVGGLYRPAAKEIILCWNTLNWRLESTWESTIIHELTHALQKCYWRPDADATGCKKSLKRELEASSEAEECVFFDDCLEHTLISSCGRSCQEFTDGLYNELERWFESQHEQFGMFPREPNYPGK